MNSANENKSLRRLLNPAGIVYVIFTFSLGISAAHHLGARLDLLTLLFGLGLFVLIRLLGSFLAAYFDHPESYTTMLSLSDPEREQLLVIRRPLLFQYILLIFTAVATLAMILIIRGAISAAGGLLLGIALLLTFFSAVPPSSFSRKGYGELVDVLLIVSFVPAFAFSLAEQPLLFFIVELTLPLMLIYMAMRIAMSFTTHGFDLIHGRHSLTTRLGWQNALVLHNIFILSAYVLVSLFLLLGFPWSLTWPILLALPVGILQIIYLQSIANGAPPKWVLLRWLAVGQFLLMVYLEIISLWI